MLDNLYRGLLAEYIAALALGIDTSFERRDWMAYDLATEDGIKIEVKSSAYLQALEQTGPSRIRFRIPRTLATAPDGSYYGTPARHSDVYVFCVFLDRDKAYCDPMEFSELGVLCRGHPKGG